ncbi:OadG family protein [Thalassotalea agariperforans]|jgi:oxaloacetate decarboxylase gamma subunit
MEQLLHLFTEAGTLMLAGMIFVFAFLGLLVVFINLVLAPLANKFPDAKPAARKLSNTANKKAGIDSGTVAAIGAAVSQYRKQRQQ